MKLIYVWFGLAFMLFHFTAQAQKNSEPPKTNALAAAEREVKEFYDAYADDLRQHRAEAIANRYDFRGYFRLGNGGKQLVPFEENKKRYMAGWTGPKSFEWKDLSIEVLSATSAAVVSLFEWQGAGGDKSTFSYTALLTKQNGQWRIRVEDESVNTSGMASKTISGDRNAPGAWKYTFTAQPGASIAAHRHTSEMRITVKTGRKFILMGDLDTAKVQRFEAGSTFVIPANTWHVEWWETETVEEIEIMAPTRTERATPATPRVL